MLLNYLQQFNKDRAFERLGHALSYEVTQALQTNKHQVYGRFLQFPALLLGLYPWQKVACYHWVCTVHGNDLFINYAVYLAIPSNFVDARLKRNSWKKITASIELEQAEPFSFMPFLKHHLLWFMAFRHLPYFSNNVQENFSKFHACRSGCLSSSSSMTKFPVLVSASSGSMMLLMFQVVM